MCRGMQLPPNGYCAWKVQPQRQCAADDQRPLGLLLQAWLGSGGVYGWRRVRETQLRETGSYSYLGASGRCRDRFASVRSQPES